MTTTAPSANLACLRHHDSQFLLHLVKYNFRGAQIFSLGEHSISPGAQQLLVPCKVELEGCPNISVLEHSQ